MFLFSCLKRINTDAFIAASTITQFTSFSEDEIHAIQSAECLAEESILSPMVSAGHASDIIMEYAQAGR